MATSKADRADVAVPPGVRQVTTGMRWMMLVEAFFVLSAGIQLFVLTEQTDTYFAWTIRSALTAASIGAAYWASAVLQLLAWRERTWARARIAVPGVLTFATLTLVVTLLHLDRFHLNSARFETLLLTWLWIAVYVLVPPVLGVLLYFQVRAPGGDPPRQYPLAPWFRAVCAVLGAAMLLLGLALLLFPDQTAPLWPWTLTTLTARVIGAWLVGVGLVAAQVVIENDYWRVEIAMPSLAALGALELVALARFPSEVSWSAPGTWIYVLFAAAMTAVGIYGFLRARGLAVPSERREPAEPAAEQAGAR
jgi:hypothetical protein